MISQVKIIRIIQITLFETFNHICLFIIITKVAKCSHLTLFPFFVGYKYFSESRDFVFQSKCYSYFKHYKV